MDGNVGVEYLEWRITDLELYNGTQELTLAALIAWVTVRSRITKLAATRLASVTNGELSSRLFCSNKVSRVTLTM